MKTTFIPFVPTFCIALSVFGASQAGADPLQEGKQFLLENRNKAGVMATATGLQYEVIQEGTGATPKATDTVKVNYAGSFISGKGFDAGNGISFPLNRVIPGWTEGVQLMKEGAKYRFFIPSELAYGAQGAGDIIPPYSALVFEVELVKVGH